MWEDLDTETGADGCTGNTEQLGFVPLDAGPDIDESERDSRHILRVGVVRVMANQHSMPALSSEISAIRICVGNPLEVNLR
ncbi:hypothetical protein H9Q72_002071 [Fusarium xylarioides]|uniref:Uncharacterized protein n=1 Tax=Fusarium xylarioides TaxID=221167 RepID=A0A9P7I6Y0_9HYPO|nr:hypothetical protein H9Q72_002071 [Fusarium xylarioides]